MPQPTTPARGARHLVVDEVRSLLRWLVLGTASGVLAGGACWAFLTVLDRATEVRLDHPDLRWGLPVVGLLVALAYERFGGRAVEGSGLLLDQIHEPTAWVPRRMAPMVGIGTVLSHLVGASVGREGTALQLSGSLTDGLARALGLRPEDRRILLTAALGGGFGAVFGVPIAGFVFGLEVQRVSWHGPTSDGRRRPLLFAGFRDRTWLPRVVATIAATVVGNAVVRALGHHHTPRAPVHEALDAALLGRAALAGVAFGLAALAFIEATDLVRTTARRFVPWAPARPALGGVVVLVAAAVVGQRYLGLSLPLIDAALAGEHATWTEPALKLGLTALCLGVGYVGGEVTPLFVIGTTLGSALAPAIGLPPAVGAALGFSAVFGAAANTPLASAVVAFELFGAGALPPALVACSVAALASGRRSIYGTQRIRTTQGTTTAADHRGPLRRRRP